MNDLEYQKLKEQSWRGNLKPAELARLQSHLAAHPETRGDWDEEAALNRLLERLPNAPVSSNFTARVLQAAERAAAQRPNWFERFSPRWLRLGWMPRVAMVASMICVGIISFHEYQLASRTKLAHGAAEFGEMATLPKMEWLKDFETINRLSKVQVADTELLALLK